jgi:hypothetical protein
MKAKEIYERTTGNIAPTHQIAYHEWYNDYVAWLEKQVEKNTVVISEPSNRCGVSAVQQRFENTGTNWWL